MWTLTGFADEVSPDFGEQLGLLTTLGVRHLEFRSAWGVKVLDLTRAQLGEAHRMLDDAGIAVSAIGSDIGKIPIAGEFGPHLDRFRHALDVARELQAPYLRLFSFFLPAGDDPAAHRDEVLARTRAFVEAAESSGVMLLHENEKGIYGDTPERCLELAREMRSPDYRLIFDPANFVQCDVRPFVDAYAALGPLIQYVHIKDALFDSHEVVPAGEGDGEVSDVLEALHRDGFDGFLSLEPHLGAFDAYGGLCGPEQWTRAHAALVGLLRDLGIEFA